MALNQVKLLLSVAGHHACILHFELVLIQLLFENCSLVLFEVVRGPNVSVRPLVTSPDSGPLLNGNLLVKTEQTAG